jgi:hypothetical protein
VAGTDLRTEALTIALRHAPPEVGVAVWAQIVTARSKDGKTQGEVVAWVLCLTMSDPINLTGTKLCHTASIGQSAPNLALLPHEVELGVEKLRTLARQRLAADKAQQS